MNPKKQTSKQLSITNQNWHKAVRVFLLSQVKHGRVLIGCTFSPSQRSTILAHQAQQTCLPADAVFGSQSASRMPACVFPAISPAIAVKGVKKGAKLRLWALPFCRSKLKQQGSPTIFTGRAKPTISPRAVRHRQQIKVVPKRSQQAQVRASPYFQRGKHER